MPSVFSHAIVGWSAGKTFFIKKQPLRFWFLSIILPILPDLDVIMFFFGIPYEHFWGHRGFFHSILFSLLLTALTMALFYRQIKIFRKPWLVYFFYFFLITASHGLLDAFTSGGLGIALLAPFNNTRYFFPVTPVQVSPLGFKAFFSDWGLKVMVSELLWIWFPSIAFILVSMGIRRLWNKKRLFLYEK